MAKKKVAVKDLKKVGRGRRLISFEDLEMKGSKKRGSSSLSSGKRGDVDGRVLKRTKIAVRESVTNSKENKIWDFKTRPDQYFVAKVGCEIKRDVITQIKASLTEAQLLLFSQTCFGHFLDMAEVNFQAQLVHYLLLRELVQDREDELWFGINGVRLKFSIDEFAVITGLKCVGECNKLYFAKESNTLLNKYFPGVKKINKQSIEELFLSKRWDSDEDAVKIAVLYFLHLYLFSSPKQNLVQKEDFDIIDSNEFDNYPWGKDLFNFTLESLKNKVVRKRKQGESLYYRLLGYPIALQIWFYECCASAAGKLCTPISNGTLPRILKWSSHTIPKIKFLKQFFVQEVNLKNISPTAEEKEKLMLDGLFQKGKDTAIDDENDFVSPGCHVRAGVSSSFVPETSRRSFSDSNIMKELKLLSSRQQKFADDFYGFKSDMEVRMSNMFDCLFEIKKLLQSGIQKAGSKSGVMQENAAVSYEEDTSALLALPANDGLSLLNSNSASNTAATATTPTASQPHIKLDKETNDTNQLQHKNAEIVNKDSSPDAKVEAGFPNMFASRDDEDVCPTCLEEYTHDNPRIVSQCNHHYHLGCINKWKERSETCPVCGKVLVFDGAS